LLSRKRIKALETTLQTNPWETASRKAATALVVCGALAQEVLQLKAKHGWDVEILAVPALLHNHPDRLPSAIHERIWEARKEFGRVVVVYGDCGTGGQLDRLLESEGVLRIRGPHCYEIYGETGFDEIMATEPGTFFLTDFLVTQFDSLVIRELGLDRHPELRDDYFGNYSRAVYLAQRKSPVLEEKAREAARKLRLPLEIRHVGYGGLESRLLELMTE
jgi:uncharacterized protein DUF1638